MQIKIVTMKIKTLIILTGTILFFNCPLTFFVGKVSSIEEAIDIVVNDIKYADDIDVHWTTDYWQTPEETWTLQTGDCEDKALLLMYYLKTLGIDSSMIIAKGPENLHSWVNFQGKYVCPASGEYYKKMNHKAKLSYEQAMNISVWPSFI